MAKLTAEQIEQRAARAKELFRNGFNCAQAVVGACADVFGMNDRELAMRMAAGFGGGMGRMRLTCGAACGMFMLAGLKNGSTIPHDSEGKMQNYVLVQKLAGEFRAQFGSITCGELLGLVPKGQCVPQMDLDPRPEERTPEYYQKRPCPEMIAEAVRIVLKEAEN